MSASKHIEPLHFSSQCIRLPEWILIFTVCLAPLLAHIISGTPSISNLIHGRPKWHDVICHYNPTSIIWRYAAITDRRIRAKAWTRYDLAVSNSIFWTANGWDGEEEMGDVASPYCLQLPETTHVRLFSMTMFKTIITTLQGLSALHTLIVSLAGGHFKDIGTHMALDNVFFPLAILGLLRQCAAMWLTDNYYFLCQDQQKSNLYQVVVLRHNKSTHTDLNLESMDPLDGLDLLISLAPSTASRFKDPQASWLSLIFRVCFLLLIAGVCVLSFLYIVPSTMPEAMLSSGFTTTSFVMGISYVFLMTVSFVTYTYYFARGKTTSTSLPCISKWWYKVYTFAITTFMLILIILASIETNRGPGGIYSTRAPRLDLTRDESGSPVPYSPTYYIPESAGNIAVNKTAVIGYHLKSYAQDLSVDEFELKQFTGYCLGRIGPPELVQ